MTKTTMSLRPGASASVRLADQRLALAGRGHVARTSQPLAAPTQPQHQQRTRVVVQAVKKWIKPEVNKNTGKAVRKEMHVREGDTVKVSRIKKTKERKKERKRNKSLNKQKSSPLCIHHCVPSVVVEKAKTKTDSTRHFTLLLSLLFLLLLFLLLPLHKPHRLFLVRIRVK